MKTKKIYLKSYPHDTAWLMFAQSNGDRKWIFWYWAWGKEWKFILQKLVDKYWEEEWKAIYIDYNQALLDVTMWFWKNDTWSIVLYVPETL